jgi:hypothetical protein
LPSPAPPLPAPEPPPPPPPLPDVPPDEVVPWLSDGASSDDRKKKGDDDIIDLSLLGGSDDQGDLDSPVTSGSDPSSWDPIDIDQIPH